MLVIDVSSYLAQTLLQAAMAPFLAVVQKQARTRRYCDRLSQIIRVVPRRVVKMLRSFAVGDAVADDGDEGWQKRMAPLMAGAVVVTAIFFAVVMLVRFASIEASLRDPAFVSPGIPWAKPGLVPTTWREQQQLARSEANFALERELITRRYRVASAVMSVRLWTRLMGFLTGMILAMVGAAFVVGKLTSPESEIGGTASGATINIKSASPGIVMAALGSVLIGITLIIPVTADVRDAAVYFGREVPADGDDPAVTGSSPPTEAADPALNGNIQLRARPGSTATQ